MQLPMPREAGPAQPAGWPADWRADWPADWFVFDEPAWRRPAILETAKSPAAPVIASRWTDPANRTPEATAEVRADYHMIGIALRPTRLALSVAGRTVHDGRVASGMLQVSGPAQPLRGLFHAPCDFLHLHVANEYLAECYEEAQGRPHRGDLLLPDPCFALDVVVGQMGQALLAAENLDGPYGRLYADSISRAIVARLLGRYADSRPPPARPKVAALAKWRLRRATEHIEAHLAEPLTLADLAGATGLTRMHFAAQFRAATGLRPHEFLLRRRIARAQELLAATNLPLVEVALSVGFRTQAHFTTVFGRFVGQTPYRWRLDEGQG